MSRYRIDGDTYVCFFRHVSEPVTLTVVATSAPTPVLLDMSFTADADLDSEDASDQADTVVMSRELTIAIKTLVTTGLQRYFRPHGGLKFMFI
jgi:hypothetical protein